MGTTIPACPGIARHQQALNSQGQSELQIDLDLFVHLLTFLASLFWSFGFIEWNPFFWGQYESPACIQLLSNGSLLWCSGQFVKEVSLKLLVSVVTERHFLSCLPLNAALMLADHKCSPVPALEKAGKAHKWFWCFPVPIKNAQRPVFARLPMWFCSGLLSSFHSTVGLIVRFFQRETPAFPLCMAQKRSCCEPAARLGVPAGHRGALPAPLPSPGGERGPQGFPRALPPWLLFASLQPHLLQATKPFYEENLNTFQ